MIMMMIIIIYIKTKINKNRSTYFEATGLSLRKALTEGAVRRKRGTPSFRRTKLTGLEVFTLLLIHYEQSRNSCSLRMPSKFNAVFRLQVVSPSKPPTSCGSIM
jgi:hypothetical protein